MKTCRTDIFFDKSRWILLLSCTLCIPYRNTDRRLQRPLQMSRSCAQPTRSLRKIALYSPVRRSYLLLDKSKSFNSDSWRLQKSSGFALTVAPRTGKGGGEPRSPRGTALGLSWTRPGTPHVRSGLFWIPPESSQLTLFHRALLWTESWHSCLEEFVDGLNYFEPALWITKFGSVLLFLQVHTLWKVIFQTITQFLQVVGVEYNPVNLLYIVFSVLTETVLYPRMNDSSTMRRQLKALR